MADLKQMFQLNTEQKNAIENFVEKARRDVPFFYEEGESEVLYVPVDDGELRVFHHVPEDNKFKRPIVFFPGFGNPPWAWRFYSIPSHDTGEYYIIDTREKKSSKIQRGRKVKFTIDQMAKDVGDVIKHLNIDKRDYILMSASWCGGVLLQGLVSKYYNPGTTIAFDPFPKYVHHKFIVKIFFGLTPPFVLEILKRLLGKIVMANMKNQSQKERNTEVVNEAVAWKWRKALLQNTSFNLYPHLNEIKNQVFLFHGPKDKYHPREIYYKVSRMIPRGRFFFMNTKDENRELLAGAIAKEFAMNTKEEGLPEFFEKFEIEIQRE